jgi:Tfp pilus assembly protein PilN
VVHLLNDLPTIVSSGIYLDKVAFKDGRVNVSGATEAHLRVVTMIRAIEASTWLKNPVIKDIVATRNSNSVVAAAAAKFGLNLNNFDMSFMVPYSKEQTEVTNKTRGRR